MNEQLVEEYKNFLNNGKTERECVEEIIKIARKKGYKDISNFSKLKTGDKVYVTKMNKAIAKRFNRIMKNAQYVYENTLCNSFDYDNVVKDIQRKLKKY